MNSKYSHVFTPIRVRGITFKNRIVLAPLSPNLCSEEGDITPELIDWMRMFARGGAAVIYHGNATIDITESRDEAYQIDMNKGCHIRNLARYADMGRQYDCHASLELNHSGESSDAGMLGHAPYGASPNISWNEQQRAALLSQEPLPAIEMDQAMIDETVTKFGMAAQRMKRAGMDICLVHGGHGNLISQFASRLYNRRTDKYGGSLENRARFAIEVCDKIRELCGERFVIEFRISADEIAEEGMHFDETLQFIGLIKDHIDILHVSAGLRMDYGMKYLRNWCQNFLMPRGFNVHYAADIKKAYPDLLVTTVGSITSIEMAEEILANGWADFVAMGRPLMADPDMPNKYAHNLPEEHRPCLRCDTCTKHLFIPKPIWCAVNPMSAMVNELRDGVIPKAPVKKRAAVIGAGPGGVQAMMTLADRGHDVTLYEAGDTVGGSVIEAARPPMKIDCADYLKWLRCQVVKYEKAGVRVLMHTKVTKEILDQEEYDAVIIAIGADPCYPDVPGADKYPVIWAPKGEEHPENVGQEVVIIGAGSVGVEAAIDLKELGRDVTIIEMSDEKTNYDRMHASAGANAKELMAVLREKEIPVHYENLLAEIGDGFILCTNTVTKETKRYECDTVLSAMGMIPRVDEADSLRRSAPETDVYVIGDAKEAGTISEAVNQAFQAALHI